MTTTNNEEDAIDIIGLESLLEQYKNSVIKFRCLYFQISDKLAKEKGLSQEEIMNFFNKKFKDAVKESINMQKKQQLSSSSNLRDNDIDNLHFQHFQ